MLSPETLRAALKDVETAYYLVHSMGSGGSFAKADREATPRLSSLWLHLVTPVYARGGA